MYYAAQVEKPTLENQIITAQKWKSGTVCSQSYRSKNLISTTAEYSNLCQDGIKSLVQLGITVKYNYSEI
jgi:hypothetical protein